jgi:hypothetical protein
MTQSDFTGSQYQNGIEVKRVFYQEPFPASARYLDPYNGFGFGGVLAAGVVGIGGFGDGLGYLMAPLNYDLQVIQQHLPLKHHSNTNPLYGSKYLAEAGNGSW